MSLLDILMEGYKDIPQYQIWMPDNARSKKLKAEHSDFLNHMNNEHEYFSKNYSTENPSDELKEYVGNNGSNINSSLWSYKLRGVYPHKTYSDIAKNIGIDSFHRAIDAHSVYTGMKSGAIFKKGLVHIPSFISTTLDPKIASQFAYKDIPDKEGHILHIKIKPSQKILYTQPFSFYKKEKEVLIPANSVLNITSTKKMKYRGYPLFVHEAHIMTPEEIEANKDHPEVMSHLKMKKELGI